MCLTAVCLLIALIKTIYLYLNAASITQHNASLQQLQFFSGQDRAHKWIAVVSHGI